MKARARLYLGIAVLLTVFAITLGCSKAPSDAQIASDIQAKLNADSGLRGKQLAVQAANGIVTISGAVDNDTQREAAARYASSEDGVKQVVNNLQITPAAEAAVVMPAAQERRPSPAPPKRRHQPRKQQEDDVPVSEAPVVAQAPVPAPAPVVAPPVLPATPPPPPPPQKVTIPSGTALSVRLVDSIDSERNQVGDVFRATLNSPISLDGEVVIPSGSNVQGHLADVKSAGKFAGKSVVVLQLDSISSGGRTYNIQTDEFKREGSSRGVNTAEKVGVGAGIGAIIGAIAGGGKGAAIGAAAGGGLGGGVQAVTKGQQIKLGSETVLSFALQAPVTVVATPRGPDADRPRLEPN